MHGNPLGDEDGAHAKAVYGYDYPAFTIPQEVYDLFKEGFAKRGEAAEEAWKREYTSFSKANPEEIKVFENAFEGNVDAYLSEEPIFASDNGDSSRVASGKILNDLHHQIPFIMGGSADVAGSVMTKITDGVNFTKETPAGRNINFGIREFAMACAQNGMLLHGGVKTYVGAFLVFSDYMKAAIRMAALSKLPGIYLFSHDSIAVGEDGPTHQPIEQLAMLRSIPNVNVIRPCDSRETYAAWKLALESQETPTALILSRQGLPMLASSIEGVAKGAYVISQASKKAEAILVATGSEVSLAIAAQKLLLEKGVDVSVVSMPSTFFFDKQSESYQHKVFIAKRKDFPLKLMSTFGWHKYAGHNMYRYFGTSAPAKDAIKASILTRRSATFVLKSIKKRGVIMADTSY